MKTIFIYVQVIFFHLLVEVVMSTKFKEVVEVSTLKDARILNMIERFKEKAFDLELLFDEVFKHFFCRRFKSLSNVSRFIKKSRSISSTLY